MGRHISDTLHIPWCHIMSSDEDHSIVIDLYVGFNISNQLVICVDLNDYNESEYNCSTAAVINYEWNEIINPTLTQVTDYFKEITECLLDEGCQFKIKRTYGKGEHMCC